jgi:hypothetical protein
MPNKYKRPEETYNTTTSTSYSNRFQDQAQQKVPLMGADLDREYNALIDNDNDLDKRLNEFVADVFPGSSAAENADKVVYSDGTRAQFSKVLERFIDSNAISTAKLQNASVTNAKMANGAISTSKLVDGSVVESKLNNGAVSNAKLADYSVSTAKMQDGSITAQKIANNAVTTEKILDNSVTTSKFADGSFTTNKIADNSLTPKKTQGCFFLGEIKHSIFEMNDAELYSGLRNGWVPISRLAKIPAACFPELRDRIQDANSIYNNQLLVKIVGKEFFKIVGSNDEYTYSIGQVDCFDFSLLLGAYPMLVGHQLPFGEIVGSLGYISVVGNKNYVQLLSRHTNLYPANLEAILKRDTFNPGHIQSADVRGYANASIAAASAEGKLNDLPGSKRRFGENSITIGLDNMPKHTHTYLDRQQTQERYAADGGDNGNNYATGMRDVSRGGGESGKSEPLPHLPPSFPVFGYMFGGEYNNDGWPK